ncbi:MAG: flagellar hook-associated protein FlgK [Treponema sp.]|jgi:flagellar hook-associated protein 1 FlgK|nr:flagellar hook-associated protein FlgK [Treponema sp.]
MTSTFMGLEIGKRGILAHQQALNTTGHNLDNLNTPGYSRQRVEMATMDPLYMPGLNRAETAGQLGQGTLASRVERVRDQLLDRRIVSQAAGEGYWQTRDSYIYMMEQTYLEVGSSSVRGNMDAFWDAWQELSLYPADSAARTSVLERGQSLVDGIHERYKALKGLQDMADDDIQLTVSQVNGLSREIAALNRDIQRIRAQGDEPNDLYDRRDLLVDQLASLIDITVDHRDPDEFMIHTGGLVLVQGNIGRQFDLRPGTETEGYSRIVWQDTGDEAHFQGGSLAALVELRDETIQEEIQGLDSMAMNFIDLVNEVHRAAYGEDGVTRRNFFSEYPFVTNVNGNYDRDGDGQFDSSYIFRINGSNALDENTQIGLNGTITLSGANGNVDIPYHNTDTVEDLIRRINGSGAEVVARLNRDGQLSFRGTIAEGSILPGGNPDFVIRHIEDSGRFLAGYAGVLNEAGPGGAYDWGAPDAVAALISGAEGWATAPAVHPAAWLELNPELVRNPAALAAGFGENGRAANAGNGEAALAIAALRNTRVMVGGFNTFDDYFAASVGRVGSLGAQSRDALETQNLIMKQLTDLRASISGVNLDEELANMIKYQQGYEAAARFITTVNSMLDTLINKMGV